jgi:16S rRNA G966 N2-methylase RsmD
MENYHYKYLKYKHKYLSLLKSKNQKGGSFNYLNFFIGSESQKEIDNLLVRLKNFFKKEIYIVDFNTIDKSKLEEFINNHPNYPIIFYGNFNCGDSFDHEVFIKYYIKLDKDCKDFKNIRNLKILSPNDIFNDVIRIVKSENIPKFPIKKGIDMSKIKLTGEGKFSYTRTKHGVELINYLNGKINNLKDLTVLDGTANMGSDTILFSLNSKNVIGIEINKENYEMLVHNTNLYKQDNIKLLLGDTTKDIFDLCFDLLYLDPPWGGEDYKENEKLDLYLGDKRFDLFIKEVIDKYEMCSLKYIVLKLPLNYNFDRLKEFGKYDMKQIGPFMVFFINLKN